MSAIGDYVHLYAGNYLKWGTQRPDRTKRYMAVRQQAAAAAMIDPREMKKQAVKDMRTKIGQKLSNINDISLAETQDLANRFIDMLMDPGSEIGEEAWQTIVQELDKNYEQMGDIIRERLDVTTGKQGTGTIKTRSHYDSTASYINTIENKLKELNNVLTNAFKGITTLKNKNEAEHLKRDLGKVRTQLANFETELVTIINGTLSENGTTIRRSSEEIKIIKQINFLIKKYLPVLPVARQKGDLTEYIAVALSAKISTAAENGVGQAIKETFIHRIGDQKGPVRLDPTVFWEGALDPHKGGIEATKLGKIIRTVRYSQNKIDVNYTFSDDQIAGLSVKNINLGTNWDANTSITISSDNSLITLLQDENADFVNHYLNVFAEHTDTNYDRQLADARRNYLDAIKLITIYKSLTGDVYGRNDMAKVFTVFNNHAGVGQDHVRYYSMNSIMETVIDNLEKDRADQQSLTVTTAKPNVFTLSHRFPNKKVEGTLNAGAGYQRVAKLITYIHNAKIHVALKTNLLNTITSKGNSLT